MNTPMIIAIITVLVMVIVVLVVKLNSAKSDRNDYKNEAFNLNNDVKGLRQSGIRLKESNAICHKQIAFHIDQLQDREGSFTTDLIFVMADTGKLAVNVKVKTVTDKEGNTTLTPTIRRKIDNEWKEVPVVLKYRPYNK
jgi:hypothetical protein